ncbi:MULTISPECIES: OB-fold nucleic acid binding domain-containing protein [unclassified Frankia]|uniref:OB-fold nucleic acid binding domain-containing protein n=1 Tax=unclassified Frankia TaxID=2632575 RepID=UPI001EF4C41D|nr:MULTISPECIES: OB-fold nucleic acid binding domain-containing protein [unclassified Frankia]
MGDRGGWWGRVVHRLNADDQVLEAEDLQRTVEAAGAIPMGECHERQEVCVVGSIRSVTVRSHAGAQSLEADIYDGTGTVTLVFLGRKHIPGIQTGRTVKAAGMVMNQDSRTTIFNPRYELLPASSASA